MSKPKFEPIDERMRTRIGEKTWDQTRKMAEKALNDIQPDNPIDCWAEIDRLSAERNELLMALKLANQGYFRHHEVEAVIKKYENTK